METVMTVRQVAKYLQLSKSKVFIFQIFVSFMEIVILSTQINQIAYRVKEIAPLQVSIRHYSLAIIHTQLITVRWIEVANAG